MQAFKTLIKSRSLNFAVIDSFDLRKFPRS